MRKATLLEKRNNMGYVYILPWIIGFLVFQLYPLLTSLSYSFTDYNMGSDFRFVGIENYVKVFMRDREARASLFTTFKYVFMSVPLKLISALLVALLLNQQLKGINFFRAVYYMPSILGGSVAIAILWRQLFAIDGTINQLITALGFEPVGFLTDPDVALFTISVLSVWQFGSSMIFFLAALKQVPKSLYEAAKVDGSGPIRNFFTITLPLISPMTLFNIVMQMINAFQEYTAPAVITNGGPLKSTQVLAMTLYNNAFSYRKMGYASAISWILFVVIILFTALVFRSSAAWAFYNDEEG